MRKFDTNVSPSFQHGIAIGLNVTETPRCSRCGDDRSRMADAPSVPVSEDWTGRALCEDCRRILAVE